MNVVAASPIDADALTRLEQAHDVTVAWHLDAEGLHEVMAPAEALLVRSGVDVDSRLLDAAPRLRLVVRAGSGTDNLDLSELHARGIRLERVPGPGADAVAEMTFALILALLRQVVAADRSVRQGQWRKHELTGRSLSGKTLGIVGAGTIGTRVGRLGAAWGMQPLGCVGVPGPAAANRLGEAGIRLTTLDEVVARADILTVHVPLTPATHHLVDRELLARMRSGVYIVTLARGGVVDEQALRASLLAGHVAGAGLDVHACEGAGMRSPLADLDNVVLTPHIGAGTHEAQQAIGDQIVDLLEATDPIPQTTPEFA